MLTYKSFLNSEVWDKQRKKAYKHTKYRCYICGDAEAQLNAHHIKYKNLFDIDEKKDLVCLCRECHFRVHALMESGDLFPWPEWRDFVSQPSRKEYKKYLRKQLTTSVDTSLRT